MGDRRYHAKMSTQRRADETVMQCVLKARGPLLLVVLPGLVLGCGSQQLETGYRYRPLNSTTVERRAFYADPYSLEARQAEAERDAVDSAPGGSFEPTRR